MGSNQFMVVHFNGRSFKVIILRFIRIGEGHQHDVHFGIAKAGVPNNSFQCAHLGEAIGSIGAVVHGGFDKEEVNFSFVQNISLQTESMRQTT